MKKTELMSIMAAKTEAKAAKKGIVLTKKDSEQISMYLASFYCSGASDRTINQILNNIFA